MATQVGCDKRAKLTLRCAGAKIVQVPLTLLVTQKPPAPAHQPFDSLRLSHPTTGITFWKDQLSVET